MKQERNEFAERRTNVYIVHKFIKCGRIDRWMLFFCCKTVLTKSKRSLDRKIRLIKWSNHFPEEKEQVSCSWLFFIVFGSVSWTRECCSFNFVSVSAAIFLSLFLFYFRFQFCLVCRRFKIGLLVPNEIKRWKC